MKESNLDIEYFPEAHFKSKLPEDVLGIMTMADGNNVRVFYVKDCSVFFLNLLKNLKLRNVEENIAKQIVDELQKEVKKEK